MLVFAGEVISWYVALPIYSTFFFDSGFTPGVQADGGAIDLGYAIWSSKIRHLGVGTMLVGGIWALVSMRGSILSGVRSRLAQYRRSAAKPPDHIEQDMPMPFVLAGIALFVIPIFVLYLVIVDSLGVALAMTVTVVATGFLFSAVTAYMSGLVGASNNPASGITIATMLFSAVLLVWLLGRDAQAGPVAAILIGAAICCAAAISGDNLQDLKAGHPRRRDALAAADDAGRRRGLRGAADGTDLEPAA